MRSCRPELLQLLHDPRAAKECTQLAFGKQVDCLTCFFVGLVCEFRICSKVNQVIGYCKTLFVIEITGEEPSVPSGPNIVPPTP